MDVFSSYEVRIGGSTTKITTRIADSLELVTRFLDELTTLISNYKAKIQSYDEEPKKTIVVGFDLNNLPAAQKGKKVANLQLCFGAHCLIIQLIHLEFDGQIVKLRRILNDQDVTFVGVDIRNKVAKLEQEHDVACKNVIELGPLADRVRRNNEYFGSKLEKLALEIVGIDIQRPKSLDSINWGARDLTSEQIEYATICAYATYAIGNQLLNGCSLNGAGKLG